MTLLCEHDGVDIYLFWATWCPYCRRLMLHIQSIEDEYDDPAGKPLKDLEHGQCAERLAPW